MGVSGKVLGRLALAACRHRRRRRWLSHDVGRHAGAAAVSGVGPRRLIVSLGGLRLQEHLAGCALRPGLLHSVPHFRALLPGLHCVPQCDPRYV